MKRFLFAALGLALAASAGLAASTINPTIPAPNSPMASAPIRGNFLAAYTDVNNLLSKYGAISAPSNPTTRQDWINTSSTPWVWNVYDGAQWVEVGTINASTHVFTPVAGGPPGGVAGGDLSGTYPNPTVASVAHVSAGVLALTNGGTNATSLTPHAVLLGGSTAVTPVAVLSNGQLLVGQTTADPLPKTMSGDATLAASGAITVANNAITNAKAAQMAANTMKGNWTASLANANDNVMPSCADSGSNHLNYVNGTGVICGTTAPAFNAAAGAVASGTTTDLSTSVLTYQVVSGNTTITSFGAGATLYRIIRFTGTPIITYNATTLITPTGANIQAAPGDTATLFSDGSGNWTIVNYQPYGGTPTVTASGLSGAGPTTFGSLPLGPGTWIISANYTYSGAAGVNNITVGVGTTTNSHTGQVFGVSKNTAAASNTGGLGAVVVADFKVTLTAATTYFGVFSTSGASDTGGGASMTARRVY